MHRVRSAEADAKASLVQFLLKSGAITSRTAIALELGLAKYANRADLAVVSNVVHFFEIKTKRDTLDRLERQLTSYEAAADKVTVVIATKHMNAVLSRIPHHFGVLELLSYDGITKIKPVRAADLSPNWRASAALDLLPAHEIRSRLLAGVGPKRRAELLPRALELPDEEQRAAVVNFLKERYLPTTKAFLRLVRRRTVRPTDLHALRVWSRVSVPVESRLGSHPTPASPPQDDEAYLMHVGKSFGPVPDEVKRLLQR